MRFFFRRDAGGCSVESEASKIQSDGDAPMQVIARPKLLGEPDCVLFRSLLTALAADAVVIPKARLADFLSLSKTSHQLKHAIRMDRKWVDFLLCDPFTMKPLVVIQRVEPKAPNAKQSDPVIAQAVKQADLVMLRIKTRENYPANKLRELILPKLSGLTEAETDSQATSRTTDLAQRETKTDFGNTDTVTIESSITETVSDANDNRIAKSLNHSKPVIVSGRTVST